MRGLVHTADAIPPGHPSAGLPAGVQGALSASVTPDEPSGPTYAGAGGDLLLAEALLSRRDEPWVDESTALTYLAFWACVRVISQTLAAVGWHVYERQGKGKRPLDPLDDATAWLLGVQASEELTSFEWRQAALKDALTCGNSFSEIERDPLGRPAWLHRVSPERVALLRDDYGRLLYRVSNYGSDYTWLAPRDVFHLRNLSPDGLVGWSNVAIARRALMIGMSIETYKASFFSRGPMPGGVLEIPHRLSEDDRKAARESFERLYGGARKAGRVVVIFGGMKFSPAELPNDDAQLIESGRFSATEMSRLFGVPPHKIGDLERASFSNIEEQERAFVADCLMPWARRLECEADVKLFGRTNRGRRWTKLNLDALLRGNSTDQMALVTQGVTGGVYTPNEGREYLDMNPVEGGDVLLIQGAMVRLDDIVNRAAAQPEPEPEPAPGAPPAGNPSGGDEGGGGGGPGGGGDEPPAPPSSDLSAALLPVFEDACRRLLRQEANRARAVLKSSNGELAGLVGRLERDHPAFVQDVFRPACLALLRCRGREDFDLDAFLSLVASAHMLGLKHRLDLAAGDPSAADVWESAAPLAAAKLAAWLDGEARAREVAHA